MLPTLSVFNVNIRFKTFGIPKSNHNKFGISQTQRCNTSLILLLSPNENDELDVANTITTLG